MPANAVRRWRWLMAFVVLVVGIVLSPLRAMAATVPLLLAYDAAVRPTATVQDKRIARTWINRYDGARVGYDDPSSLPAAAPAGATHVYDRALELPERRELTEGVIYDAPAGVMAAEGVEAGLSGRALLEQRRDRR